jgi:hypothetical protein
MAEQARWKDACVVDDQQIPAPQKIGQLADRCMSEGSRVAMKMQQTRSGALSRRHLRDELWWEIEVELADIHVRGSC